MTRDFKIIYSPFLSLLIFSSFTHPQPEVKFEHITTGQGLSTSCVYAILQDRQGFLWFGTSDGLNRYDGYNFTIFKSNPFDPNSLSSNVIYALYEDRAGNLWVGASRGLHKFNRKTQKFTPYKHDPDVPHTLSHNSVWTIYEDKTNTLWIGTLGGGLNRFDSTSGQFTCYKNDPADTNSLNNDYVISICEDSSGFLWFGTGGGLDRFDRKTGQFKHYRHDPADPYSLSSKGSGIVYIDKTGVLWAGGWGLSKFDKISERFIRYRPNPNDPNSISAHTATRFIYEDGSGIFWIGTWGGGLNRFDPKTEKFTHYKPDPANPHSISDDNIISICEDKSGALWFGTGSNGLNKFNRKKEKFVRYKPNLKNSKSLPGQDISAIGEDQFGNLWIGTYDQETYRYDRATGEYTEYKWEQNNPYSLPVGYVRSIYKDRSGVLWLGTVGYLNKFESEENRFIRYRYPVGVTVLAIYEDQSSRFWVGTLRGGLSLFNRETGEFTRLKSDFSNSRGLNAFSVVTIYEDPSENLWFGTYNGLYKLISKADRNIKKDELRFVHYKNDPANPRGLSHNIVGRIYQDSSGIFWLGTPYGLNRFEPEKEEFTHFFVEDGLPSNSIYGIEGDKQGNLWISTPNGLSKFSPSQKSFKNYTVSDGLQSNEFNYHSHYQNTSGEMFFGGAKGFNSFYPDSIKDNPHIPPIVLTDFKLFNNPVELDTSITEIKQIVLSHNENFFSFEFVALDYTAPEKNQYAYRLEGLDRDWIYNGNRHLANYTRLDPGEYIFRVKGSNNDGIWNEEGASLRIVITPPWWKTGYAYTIYIVLIGVLLYALRKYDLHRQRLKQELELEHIHAAKLEEIDHMKSRFFANISHEFRTPLTLISGPLEKLLSRTTDMESRKDIAIMQRNAQRLHRLINQLLDISKLEAGRMKLQTREEDLILLLKGIVQAFESMAGLKEIQLGFYSEIEELPMMVDREVVEKILSNLLSNAFKFTPEGGSISIAVGRSSQSSLQLPITTATSKLSSEIIMVSVTDTGIGIPTDRLPHIFDRFYQVDSSQTREQEGTGIGLALTKELVELHKGKISVESEEGKGTTFVVHLPMGLQTDNEVEVVEEPTGVAEEISVLVADAALQPELETPFEAIANDNEEAGESAPLLLIVDDNADVRSYLRSYLLAPIPPGTADAMGDSSYRIMEAADGKEGLQKAIDNIPDLVISDVMMPKMDGFELCAKLKNDERTSHIPIILLTARAADEDKIEGLEIGADAYLIKPFNPRELLVRAKSLIEQRRKLREHFSKGISIDEEIIFTLSRNKITSIEEQFLRKAINIVETHLTDADFSVEMFGREIGMSRVQLHRKLRALVNRSASQFIRTLRLNSAARLLKKHSGNVTEIAYQVGFNNLSYFAKCFQEQFGQSPSQYAAQYTHKPS